MARLGELLVAAGLLTVEQVEQALRAQVMWGGRLGTNVVELGYLDLDKLAQALGRQHRLPAALGRHFDRSDPALQALLSADVAERFSCVPLLRTKDGAQVIVAACEPLPPRALAIVADELALAPPAIVQAVAAELRIKYHLERIYKIPRGARFLRPRGATIPPFPQFEIDPLAFEDSQVDVPLPTETAELPVVPRPTTGPLAAPPADTEAEPEVEVDLDPDTEELDEAARAELRAQLKARLDAKAAADVAAPRTISEDTIAGLQGPAVDDLSALASLFDEPGGVPEHVEQDESSGRERRRYIRTLDAAPSSDSERQQRELGRIAIRRITAYADPVAEAQVSAGKTLGEATRAIRRSQDRDRVAELVLETLFRFSLSSEAALLLVVRGDAAQSWKGFTRSGAPLPETAVPLDHPGVIPRAVERNATVRSPASDLGPIDQLLLVSLGQRAGDLVAVPVSISGQVLCVIALVTAADASVATAESVAAAAGAAFARLMRYASR